MKNITVKELQKYKIEAEYISMFSKTKELQLLDFDKISELVVGEKKLYDFLICLMDEDIIKINKIIYFNEVTKTSEEYCKIQYTDCKYFVDSSGNLNYIESRNKNGKKLKQKNLTTNISCEYTYDDFDNRLSFTYSDGRWSKYVYDDNNNCTKIIRSDGFIHEHEYDINNIKICYKWYNFQGFIKTENVNIIEYKYDSDGILVDERIKPFDCSSMIIVERN